MGYSASIFFIFRHFLTFSIAPFFSHLLSFLIFAILVFIFQNVLQCSFNFVHLYNFLSFLHFLLFSFFPIKKKLLCGDFF